MKYIDTHSHIYEKKFDEDREDVLKRMEDLGVSTITIGTGLETSKKALTLAKEEAVVVGATIGVHPTDTNEGFDPREYEELLSEEVVGIGECGFDYFRVPREEVHVRQREIFEAQVSFALDNGLPLMLHIRPSEGSTDAHEDVLEVLKLYEGVRGTVHFFTSNKEVAREYVALGFMVSFPGVITFAPELNEVVRDMPLDMILAETDSPYAAPVPHRGKRNEPIFVIDVIKAIAEIRGEDFDHVSNQINENAEMLFLSGK